MRSVISVLNRSSPKIEPWGTPDSMSLLSLKFVLILTRSVRYDK